MSLSLFGICWAKKTGIFILGTLNSTFPPCIWLLRGFCLELYPYCLFPGHGIVFFSNQDFSTKGVCVCGVVPKTTPEAEKSRLEKKDNPKIEV